jgi:hypothetical protein
MAYAKTTPLHVILQVGIGASLGAVYYFKFYRCDDQQQRREQGPVLGGGARWIMSWRLLCRPLNNPTLTAQAAVEASKEAASASSSAQVAKALEEETKRTTAQVWGLDTAKAPSAASKAS